MGGKRLLHRRARRRRSLAASRRRRPLRRGRRRRRSTASGRRSSRPSRPTRRRAAACGRSQSSPSGRVYRGQHGCLVPARSSRDARRARERSAPVLARLRESEPVSWVPALDGWLVTRRDLVLQAMRDPATFTVDDPRFSTAQVVGPSMLSLDGGEHGATAIRSPAVSARCGARAIQRDRATRGRAAARRDRAARARPTCAPSLPGRSSVEVDGARTRARRDRTDEALGWYAEIVADGDGDHRRRAGRRQRPRGVRAAPRAVEHALDRDPAVVARRRGSGGAGGLDRERGRRRTRRCFCSAGSRRRRR